MLLFFCYMRKCDGVILGINHDYSYKYYRILVCFSVGVCTLMFSVFRNSVVGPSIRVAKY